MLVLLCLPLGISAQEPVRAYRAEAGVGEGGIEGVLARGRGWWRDYAKKGEELLAEAGLIHDPIERIHILRKILSCYPQTPAAEQARVELRGLVTAQPHGPQLHVTVCPWKDNKEAAVSLTFDDAVPHQIKYHVPLMEERGFRGTFFVFVNAIERGQGDNWEPWAELAQRGHEIGAHTVSHPRLVELSDEKIKRELEESNRIIGERIGAVPLTLAYPYAQHNERVRRIARGLYISARSGSSTVAPPTPVDLYDVPSFVPATNTSLSEMNSWVDAALQTGGWMVDMIHGIEGQGWQPIPRERYEAHFDYLAEREDRLWVATYAEVAKYIREREAAVVDTIEVGKDRAVFELLMSDLDGGICDEPLTLRLEVPFDWAVVTVEQGESISREARCLAEEHGKVVYFDAVPNGGEIMVEVVERGVQIQEPREAEVGEE